MKRIFLIIVVILAVTACRSHKKASAPAGMEVEGASFLTSCYPIESLSAPSCRFEITVGGKSYSLTGSIYIQPDSICYFTGKWLLFELRGAIYRDSFVVVNYLERICYKGKNDYLEKLTGFPVNPQSLMMLFTADKCEEIYRNKFNFNFASENGERILMQGKNRSLFEIKLNAGDRTMERITLYNDQQRQPVFSAIYGGYNRYPRFALPAVFDISAHDGEKPIRIKAEFRQIMLNQPQRVNLNVPSRYEAVILQGLK